MVVGTSAGGLDALSTVLGGLDTKLPAAVVIAQHLDPDRRSHLQGLLQRKTGMSVVALERRTKLETGTVYVPPPDSDVVVSDGHVELMDGGGARSQPSVDRLLTTAAHSYGERLIAVILTGNGSDGSSGAVAVKQAGGTVVIQDPRTAPHPSMPAALPPTAVDHVSDVEDIAPLLRQLLSFPAARDPEAEAATHVGRIVDLLAERSTVDFRSYKTSTVLRRVERRMATNRIATVAEYASHLATHPEEVAALAQALIIKVTEFFRDPEAFQFLRSDVLPRLLESRRRQGRRLRIWSAGCATGEEPYSLAMLVTDALGSEVAQWSVRVFATDLDDGAVAFGRRGIYPPAVLENVPDEYRKRFFEEVDGASFRVHRNLRQIVIYGQQDLSRAVPFPRIDLVVCRNLLIYFQPELQQDVLDLFAYSLHDSGGYLMLGRAETARPSTGLFEVVDKKWKVYRCLGGPVGFRGATAHLRPTAAEDVRTLPPRAVDEDASTPRRFDDLVLRAITVGVVVVDRAYRMVAVNAAARRLLGVRDRGGDHDFLHSVREIPYNEIRAAIDGALRDRKTVILHEISLGLGDDAIRRYANFSFTPLADTDAAADRVAIVVVDATAAVAARQKLEAVEAAQRTLVEELNATNSRLNDANRDLLDTNDALQSANEELMMAQEELQATNEEFEATNEELQATNEELETNNEELQATNEELDTTNAELQARTVELQELSSTVKRESERLSEIIGRCPVPLLVVRGQPAVVEMSNPLFAAVVGQVAAGQSVEEVFAAAPGVWQGIRQALARNATHVTDPIVLPPAGARRAARTYVFTVLPLREGAAAYGAGVYAEDVTDSPPTPPASRNTRKR